MPEWLVKVLHANGGWGYTADGAPDIKLSPAGVREITFSRGGRRFIVSPGDHAVVLEELQPRAEDLLTRHGRHPIVERLGITA